MFCLELPQKMFEVFLAELLVLKGVHETFGFQEIWLTMRKRKRVVGCLVFFFMESSHFFLKGICSATNPAQCQKAISLEQFQLVLLTHLFR